MQLVINAGSSSLKFSLYNDLSSDAPLLSGQFDRLGGRTVFVFGGRSARVSVLGHEDAVHYLLDFFEQNKIAHPKDVSSVVHRVVHGGEKYHGPVLIDESVLLDIERLSVLAPLHNPANLAGIWACQKVLPDVPQIAVFDTAFHHTIPKEVFLYAIPLRLYREFDIRKYGFHGINHSYIATKLKEVYGSHIDAISCHLGSGSSITALRSGISVDTTMGFTPLDGVMMATRSGELDPEIPLFLLREGHMSVSELEDLLSRKSGLLGLTGYSDLRDVKKAALAGDEHCLLALKMLSYRVAYFVNAMKTAVPDFKALVFTAGIGEGADYLRSEVCAFLGIDLDVDANRRHDFKISAAGSPFDVFVIPADEQLQMHRLSRSLL